MGVCKYDVSVVIPVYNTEPYLNACFLSLKNQSFAWNRMQIIFINDGSQDNSAAIMNQFAAENDNVIAVTQKNSGVSAARNNGVKLAEGKYILFLDSDDYLSANAVSSLFRFAEKHNSEADLFTYPIINDTDGQLKLHSRYKALFQQGTGIYDVSGKTTIVQPTVNVFIRNYFENNILFSEGQSFQEDERFTTEIILKKNTIGYVEKAKYYYRRHAGTATNNISKAYYCFEQVTDYYRSLFEKYAVNGTAPKYLQSVFINNLNWRIKQDDLLPYHYQGEAFKKAVQVLQYLLSFVEIETIAEFPSLSSFYKAYLLRLKGEQCEVSLGEYKGKIEYYYCCHDIPVVHDSEFHSVIYRYKIHAGSVLIQGNLATPVFETTTPVLMAVYQYKNGTSERKEIPLTETNFSYYNSNMKTNRVYGYRLEIPMADLKSVRFVVPVNKVDIPVNCQFNRFCYQTIHQDGMRAAFSRNNFRITENTIINRLWDTACQVWNDCKLRKPKVLLYRLNARLHHIKKPVWLYCDKAGLLDNGWIQFCHDIPLQDGVERYYVYHDAPTEEMLNAVRNNKGKLLRFKSKEHMALFLDCDKVITSFIDLQVYCPYGNGIRWYKDLKHYELVYLQHGVLHASLRRMYAKEYTEIDKFIISSEFEKNNLTGQYSYDAEDLIMSGMPRMAQQGNIVQAENRILFAPSWRQYLIGNLVNNKREAKTEQFKQSEYFLQTYAFLHSKVLNDLLEKNDLYLDYQLHPIFRVYEDMFDLSGSSRIHVVSGGAELGRYKICITDFSSIQFDFLRLIRPIAYFVPDMPQFLGGLHTYRELDLKYEDAFGPLCLTGDQLAEQVNAIIANQYQPAEPYKTRMTGFFSISEDPCETIYRRLTEEE